MDDETEQSYRWEGGYKKTWETLKEDESGSLQASIDEEIQKAKRKRLAAKKTNVRLGMMRHLFIVLDMSAAMDDQDLKPNRATCCLKMLEIFIEEFFDQNPIGQIGIITTKDKRAEILSGMSGSSHKHSDIVKRRREKIIKENGITLTGEPSLQNSLEICQRTLKQMPKHASREVLIIMGSLTTCDPGSLYDTINELKTEGIRCSTIGLSAEVHICSRLTKETGGYYGIILDENHFLDLLRDHIPPPSSSAHSESSLIKMGFPQHVTPRQSSKISLCMSTKRFTLGGYYCPQCHAKYSELPVQCVICNLTLVSAPHLARSYHHLFPLPTYNEKNETGIGSCFSCAVSIKSDHPVHVCAQCNNGFCIDCNLYIRDTLHCCPGCINSRCELKMKPTQQ